MSTSTLASDVSRYMAVRARDLAPHSLRAYERQLLLLAEHLRPDGLLDVGRICAFVEEAPSATSAIRCAAVRGFLAWHPSFLGDPEVVQPPRSPGPVLEALPADEVEALWWELGAAAPRARAIVAVLLGCGLQSSECTDLDWERVNDEYLLVDGRRVAMPRAVRRALSDWRSGSRGLGPVFINRRGERLSGRSLCVEVSAFGEAAGIADLNPRALRRACLAEHRRRGRTPEQIALLLGYGSPTLVRRALGELAAEIVDCECSGGCLRCGGTRVRVTAPPEYIRRVAPRTALARLFGRARELSQIADAEAVAPRVAVELRSLAARVEGAAEWARHRMLEAPLTAEAPLPPHESLQVRLRAVASETRKLAQVFLGRGWADEAWEEEVEGVGCRAELLSREVGPAKPA